MPHSSSITGSVRPSFAARGAAPRPQGLAIRLGYRPPYDVQGMLGFFAKRELSGVEFVSRQDGAAALGRTLSVPFGRKSS
jgi:AraC family transcriptional regulator of adaptative response / DNA-3-methyladenine glycosylase II